MLAADLVGADVLARPMGLDNSARQLVNRRPASVPVLRHPVGRVLPELGVSLLAILAVHKVAGWAAPAVTGAALPKRGQAS